MAARKFSMKTVKWKARTPADKFAHMSQGTGIILSQRTHLKIEGM